MAGELYRTDTQQDHHHFIYITESQGTPVALMSFAGDESHSHEITWQESIPPVVDTETQEVKQEAIPGRWIVQEKNGHTHQYKPIMRPPDLRTNLGASEKRKKVDMVHTLFKAAREYEADFREMARESEKFYNNDQWEDAVLRKLDKAKRTALTINEIQPKIDLLVGYQAQNRFDISYLPQEDGDSKVADVLNIVTKNILEKNGFKYEETAVFEDGLIVGRGLFQLEVDYNLSLDGAIKIRKIDWDTVFFGPHTRKDCEDLEYLVAAKWVQRRVLDEMYPSLKDEFQYNFDLEKLDEDNRTIDATEGEDYQDDKQNTLLIPNNDEELIDLKMNKMRVLRLQRRIYRDTWAIVNKEDDLMLDADRLLLSDINQIAQFPGMQKVQRLKQEREVVEVAGSTLLDYEIDTEDLDVIPFYVKKRKGKVYGKVELAKDPQREINKRHSQMIDIMNKVALFGRYYYEQTFANPSEERAYKENANNPGFIAKLKQGAAPPGVEQGIKFPAELATIMNLESQKIREIMNVTGELLGQTSRQESGIAIQQKQRQGLIGNDYLFDNLALAKKRIGKWLVRMIKKVYTPQRIARLLVLNQERNGDMKIGGIALKDIPPKELEKYAYILETNDLEQYDIVISESAYSPSRRQANFAQWAEIVSKGYPLPPELLIELSDLPDKERVINQIRQTQAQAQQAEQAKNETEIKKTLIANQGKGAQ